MAKISWATDVHLDHVDDASVITFAESLLKGNPDSIVLSGDISTADKIVYHLSMIESVVQRPLHFVCGNHDYYNGSIEAVRKQLSELSNMSQYIKYLPTIPYVQLSPSTALIGHDCWYDALNGDWRRSNFNMSDWFLIKEFAQHPNGPVKSSYVELAKKLAHEGVLHIHNSIKAASKYYKNIIIVSHVPPFERSHIFEGKVGDAHAQPWFTCKMLGDMLMDASKAFPKINFTVLAGHTHGRFNGTITNNLSVHVGEAEYGMPLLQQLIEAP